MSNSTYTYVDITKQVNLQGLDFHGWVETIEGEIIDEDFSSYDLIKIIRNCEGEKIYCELVGEEERKKVWKYIYKKCLKNKIKDIENLGCYGYENWYSYWEQTDKDNRNLNCFMNAYQYHLQNPKTTRLCFGKMGWKKINSNDIWWEFG